jgi:hypothetical protein
MANKSSLFKVLGTVVILLVIALVALNAVYIKTGCLNRKCLIIGISSIALLLWATAFWFMVLRYSKKEK